MAGADEVADLGIDGLDQAVRVGSGAFGAVYRARQARLNRVVAVKVLTTVLDAAALERFEREGYAMGSVAGHPNIVQVLGVGTTASGRPYLLMPYMPRGSLDDAPPMPWQDALRHAVRLCGALATAHQAGILHRDVKPANILVSEFGEPLLADFGIARMTSGFQTAVGVVHASLSFAPPEIFDGGPATVAADLYSLAATVHCLIAGEPPFDPRPGEPLASLYLRISRDPPPNLRALGVPDVVSDALEKALAKYPEDRPGSAVELGELLQDGQRRSGQPVTSMALTESAGQTTRNVSPDPGVTLAVPNAATMPATESVTVAAGHTAEDNAVAVLPPTKRKRRGIWAVLAVAFVVVIAAVTGFFFWPHGGKTTTSVSQPQGDVSYPTGLAVAPDGSVYVSDQDQHRLIRVTKDGVVTVVAGNGKAGNTGDGGLATEAGLDNPSSVALTRTGEVYLATGGVVRLIDAQGMIGPVTGPPLDFAPALLVVAPDGTVYGSDKKRILVRSPAGAITALTQLGDLGSVDGMALSPAGWLAVSDAEGHQVVRIDKDGKRSRIVGIGSTADAPVGDGYPARESEVPAPTGLAFDPQGRLYFSDAATNRVRVVEAKGTLRTVAGSPEGYSEGYSGDGGPGRKATFRLLGGPLAFDADGNLYIGDVANHHVRRLSPDGVVHPFV